MTIVKINSLVGKSIVEHLLKRFICRTIPFASSIVVTIDVDPSYLMEYREYLKLHGYDIEISPLVFPLDALSIASYPVIVQAKDRAFGLKEIS